MIVVEVNVVAYYFIEGEKTGLAREAFPVLARTMQSFVREFRS